MNRSGIAGLVVAVAIVAGGLGYSVGHGRGSDSVQARLTAHEDGSYEWVSPSDYRVAEVRLLHDAEKHSRGI
jgi:hypothetical protein